VGQVEFAAVVVPARQQEAQVGVDAQPDRAGRYRGLHHGDVGGIRTSHGTGRVQQNAGREPSEPSKSVRRGTCPPGTHTFDIWLPG